MKFKPFTLGPHKGIKITEPDQVVPDQSLSLKEILTRFVRHEALPVGQRVAYGSEGSLDPESDSPLNIDQEKARYMDLTEKDEFKEMVSEATQLFEEKQKQHDAQSAAEKQIAEEKERQKRIRIAARKLANKKTG